MWIDIEDSAGNILGEGPITTATGWSQTGRLNAAGQFSFVMPAGDSRRALIQQRRVARCWDYDAFGGIQEVGAGVIHALRTVAGDGPAMVEVSGPDLLGQLVDRSVGLLQLMDDTELTPAIVSYVTSGSSTGLTNAYDGNPATVSNVTLTWPGYPDEWIYVEYPKAFHAVEFDLGANVNAVVATLKAQFYNEESGGGWEYAEILSDGTAVAGAPFAQDGLIELDVPSGWGKIGANYIIRFYAEATLDDVDFAEVTVFVWSPVADALDRVLAFAPTGWSLDAVNGYAATGADVYLSFAGESVLTALVRIAETLGENFILGAGKTIIWLQDDATDNGLRAVSYVDGIAAEANDAIVLVQDIRVDEDASELCTRVLAWGGGIGEMRPTLADTTRAAPTGYTLSTTGNYLLCDAAEAAYGQIEQPLLAQDVVAKDTTLTQKQQAADTLFDRALEYLTQHAAPLTSYEAQVVKCASAIQPGYQMRLVYDEWVDTYHALAVDALLWLVEVRRQIGADGVRVTGLRLATLDRLPVSGEALTVATMSAARSLAGANPPQVGRNSAAQGIPTFVAVEDGLVTQISREIPVADGAYNTGIGPIGNMGTVTIRGGVIVGVVEAT